MHLLKSVYHHFCAMYSHGKGRKTLSFKEWDSLIKSAFKYKPKPKSLGVAMLDLLHTKKKPKKLQQRWREKDKKRQRPQQKKRRHERLREKN